MKVKAWVHPKGIVRVSITEGFAGKSVPLEDVDPATVVEWLEKAEMDGKTREVLEAYLQNWL